MKCKVIHGKGNHLVLDAKSDSTELDNPNYVQKFLVELVSKIEMTVIGGPDVHVFQGEVSGQVVLSESNITIHTFPKEKGIMLDIFSCNEFDIDKAIEFIRYKFNIRDEKLTVYSRGIDELKKESNIEDTGNHLIADVEAKGQYMSDVGLVEQSVKRLAQSMGMEPKEVTTLDYDPEDKAESGVTSIALCRRGNERGHIAIHTYPHESRNYVAFDVFTTAKLEKDTIVATIHENINPTSARYNFVERTTLPQSQQKLSANFSVQTPKPKVYMNSND